MIIDHNVPTTPSNPHGFYLWVCCNKNSAPTVVMATSYTQQHELYLKSKHETVYHYVVLSPTAQTAELDHYLLNIFTQPKD